MQTEKTLGAFLRGTRTRKGLGLRELARQAEINAAYLSDIEHDRRIPSEDVLRKVATCLDVPFDDLMVRACRLGESGEEYFRRHPVLTRMLRRMAEADLPEAELEKVARYVEGRIAQQEKTR